MRKCRTCGFDFGIDFDEIWHIRDPGVKTESKHLTIDFSEDGHKEVLTHYGALYNPNLYPLLEVSKAFKVHAALHRAELMQEVRAILSNPELANRIIGEEVVE
jgi:hypothetical protein